MAGFVGREALGKGKLRRAEIDAPEFGGVVCVRELNGAEIAIVRQVAAGSVKDGTPDPEAVGNFERSLVERGWIDGEGNRVLGDGEGELLRQESARLVNLMATKIAELSGLNASATADAKKN